VSYSQHGEDEILAALFRKLGIEQGTCVEFGAYDGMHLSNTRMFVEQGWQAVLIEADAKRFEALSTGTCGFKDVTLVKRVVGFDAPDTLDEILAEAPWFPSRDFDLVSIDIDGCDYHVWEASKLTPKVVCIEMNPTFPNTAIYVQPRDLTVQHGSSLHALALLAEKKGYALYATTIGNAIFVRNDLRERAGVPLYDDLYEHLVRTHNPERALCCIAQLFDGTILQVGGTGAYGKPHAP
jgi:hypothetical protein